MIVALTLAGAFSVSSLICLWLYAPPDDKFIRLLFAGTWAGSTVSVLAASLMVHDVPLAAWSGTVVLIFPCVAVYTLTRPTPPKPDIKTIIRQEDEGLVLTIANNAMEAAHSVTVEPEGPVRIGDPSSGIIHDDCGAWDLGTLDPARIATATLQAEGPFHLQIGCGTPQTQAPLPAHRHHGCRMCGSRCRMGAHCPHAGRIMRGERSPPMNSQPAATYQPQHIRERGEQAVLACQDPELLVWPDDPGGEAMRWVLRQAPDERQVANILLIGMNPSTATALSADGSGGDPTTRAMFGQFGMVLDYMNSLDGMPGRGVGLEQCRLTLVNLSPFVGPQKKMREIAKMGDPNPHMVALPYTKQILHHLIPRSDLVVPMWGAENSWKKKLAPAVRQFIAQTAKQTDVPVAASMNKNGSPAHPGFGGLRHWKHPFNDYLPYLLRG